LRWIKARDDEDVFIETAEDVDLSSPGQIEADQLKRTATSLSLKVLRLTLEGEFTILLS